MNKDLKNELNRFKSIFVTELNHRMTLILNKLLFANIIFQSLKF